MFHAVQTVADDLVGCIRSIIHMPHLSSLQHSVAFYHGSPGILFSLRMSLLRFRLDFRRASPIQRFYKLQPLRRTDSIPVQLSLPCPGACSPVESRPAQESSLLQGRFLIEEQLETVVLLICLRPSSCKLPATDPTSRFRFSSSIRFFSLRSRHCYSPWNRWDRAWAGAYPP